MKPFERYLTHLTDLRKFLDTYLEMRQYFQELDFSEKDMESPCLLYTSPSPRDS